MFDAFPSAALIGGIIIGIASLSLLLFTGKIAGISGIYRSLFEQGKFTSPALLFVLGLLLSPLLYQAFVPMAPILFEQSLLTYIIAGLLVGIGTTIGNGCTSGHGICGLGRLSWRSLIATGVFMVVAVLVATLF